jgi:pimeloyl-ACP methyl ester carboxylesterase
MLSRADLRADIARLPQSVKMQVVVADHDIITPPGANRRAAAARANTPVHVIPRAGHAAYLEKPADFEGLLLRLIES